MRETLLSDRQLNRSLRWLGFAGVLLTFALTARAEIKVTNLKDGETLRYPIAFLRGTTDALGELQSPIAITTARTERMPFRSRRRSSRSWWSCVQESIV